jgi:hypothetical protein
MAYKQKYNSQKAAAKVRGIDFQFTYEEWLAWWGVDIINRGKCKGQLVMARIGDKGSYHPDNCVKKTCSENASEGNKGKIYVAWNKGKPQSKEHKRKLSIARNNQTEETKEKISASIKEVWAKRKLDKELS